MLYAVCSRPPDQRLVRLAPAAADAFPRGPLPKIVIKSNARPVLGRLLAVMTPASAIMLHSRALLEHAKCSRAPRLLFSVHRPLVIQLRVGLLHVWRLVTASRTCPEAILDRLNFLLLQHLLPVAALPLVKATPPTFPVNRV